MRMLGMLLLGIVIGALGTVMAINALRQGIAPGKAAMALTAHHSGQLRRMGESGSCDAAAIAMHLRQLRALGNELEGAFLPTGGDDDLFRRHAANYREVLDRTLAAPPLQCEPLTAAMRQVGAECKACHQDFRG